jgi:protoheme IX farnesyltransferase
MNRHLSMLLELGKVRISVLASISMVAGYLLARGAVTWSLAGATLGVFLLASGASGLNQIQERDIDAAMVRTRGRPLPSGRANLTYAVAASVLFLVCGCLVLLAATNVLAMVLGLAAVGWYNGVYTPLKRVSGFAAVPGGVVGAIPPVIGWVAGGGWVLDPRIAAVSFFFFMWQVPHFWLLLLFTCGSDYEKAGIPSMTRAFSLDQISRMTFMWILGTAMACVVIPLFGVTENPWVIAGFFAAGAWLVLRSVRILGASEGGAVFRRAFKYINLYVVWVIGLLSLGSFLR